MLRLMDHHSQSVLVAEPAAHQGRKWLGAALAVVLFCIFNLRLWYYDDLDPSTSILKRATCVPVMDDIDPKGGDEEIDDISPTKREQELQLQLDMLTRTLDCQGPNGNGTMLTELCLERASQVEMTRNRDQEAIEALRVFKAAQNSDYKETDVQDNQHEQAVLTPMAPEYVPGADFAKGLADVSIVGLGKAGTSQLYSILSSHPAAIPLNQGTKEYCMGLPRDVLASAQSNDKDRVEIQRRLFEWHEKAYKASLERHTTQMTINGCISTSDYWMSERYLRNTTTSANNKYILLLRDPADWMWAVWNFWVDSGLDAKLDTPGKWANSDDHYRSPEMFHELVLSGKKTRSGCKLVQAHRLSSVKTGRKLVSRFGKENVLFLRNEDMLPAVVDRHGGMLDQLSNFTGLERSNFRQDGLKTIRNCNDNKGTRSNCGNSTSSAYQIAGNREMLEATRTLLYLHFQEECRIWADEFGAVYPNCLNAAASESVLTI